MIGERSLSTAGDGSAAATGFEPKQFRRVLSRFCSWPRIRAARRFAVNILGERQVRTSRAFAVTGADKFAGVPWRMGSHGCPLIEDALAHIQCSIETVYFASQYGILAPPDAAGGPASPKGS
jgi:flavin reductase (DIM6/NTAB) family NADH-FMN oxidoreductase RutF